MTETLLSAEAETPDETEAFTFRRRESEEDELDMTPMVDVTFLLLIFFMVTAAFSLQKSIEQPTPDQQESATQSQTIEDLEDDYVIVRIDREDEIWVEDSVAQSEQDLLERLREATGGLPGSDSKGPSSLLVLADSDCHHEVVIRVLDAGSAVGMESIRLHTADQSEY